MVDRDGAGKPQLALHFAKRFAICNAARAPTPNIPRSQMAENCDLKGRNPNVRLGFRHIPSLALRPLTPIGITLAP